MTSPAINDVILELFDYASQGLPRFQDALKKSLGCQSVHWLEEQYSPAANDPCLPEWTFNTPLLRIDPNEKSQLLLQLEHHKPVFLSLRFSSASCPKSLMNNADLLALMPHIQQAAILAREISEQTGDAWAMQYVMQHHPLNLADKQLHVSNSLEHQKEDLLLNYEQSSANDFSDISLCKDMLIREFNLTPSEAELSQAIFHGKSLQEITENRHVSKQTVRKQLQSVMKKTGTESQETLLLLLFERCLLTKLV